MKLRRLICPSLLIASAAVAAAQSADLALYHYLDKANPLVGTHVTFTVQVYNDGLGNATGVNVTSLLPAGYELVSAVPGTGTYNPVNGVWNIGSLPFSPTPAAMTITAKVLATGTYKNDASVTANETDPDPANNTASATAVPTTNLYWDGGTADINPVTTPPSGSSEGGAGTWNTTLKNWDFGATETTYMAWNNTPGYTANFGGTAGTVTLESDITAGKLAIAGAYTIALDTYALTLNGTGTTISGNAAIVISGTGALTLGSAQTWDNNAAASTTMTISAPVSTGSNLLTLNTRSNNLDITGKISGSGGLTVNSSYTSGTNPPNSSPAVPTLNNVNDYTGTTTINGWIWLNSGDLAAFGADTSDLVFNSGGVRLSGTGTIARGIQITGTSGISKTAGTTTVNGVISGTGNFQVSANFGAVAPVVLANANTFTGNCLAGPDGIVRLAHADALGSANLRWNDNNGRSQYDLATHNLAYVIGGLGNATATNVSSNLNLGSGTEGGGDGLVSFGANHQSNTYVGSLTGSAGFKKTGSGTQTLIGENSYSGHTVIASGTLKLGRITGQTGVNCTTGTTGSNVKRLTVPSSANLYIGQAVSGPLIPAGARITNINTGTQVTIDPGPTSPATATTVNFADMTGSVANSPVIGIQSGASLDVSAYPWSLGETQTLTGSGTVTGSTTITGTIAPGASTGTLTTGDLTFASTGIYACELNGTQCDLLAAGTLTVDPAARITFSGTPTAASYVIATYTGAAPAHFATDATLPSGYALDYNEAGRIKLVGGSAGTPFETWAASPPNNLSGNDALPGADPDKDGVGNIAEFALGGDPKDGSKNGISLAKVQDVNGTPALTLTIATRAGITFNTGTGPRTATKDGVTYTIQGGQDLSGWNTTITEVTPALTSGLPPAPSGYEYHTFKTAGPVSNNAKDFVRVKVEGQ